MSWKLRPEFQHKQASNRLHRLEVPLIGLTGGIASGKSTVSHFLQQKGAPLICADQLVKEAYQQEDVIATVKELAPEVIHKQQILFPKLRELFFQNALLKDSLEKRIYAHLPQLFQKARQSLNEHSCLIYDVPLLFERKIADQFDLVLLIYVDQQTQLERLLKRDAINPKLAQKIMSQQLSLEQKKAKTPFVFDNSKERENFDEWPALDTFLKKVFIY